MFFPIGDDNRYVHRTPFIVWTLLFANAAVWFLQISWGDAFTYGFSVVPYEITSGTDLVRPQSLSLPQGKLEIPQAPGPSPIFLTLMSAMFMHGSWMHIFGNMLYLLIFGDQIEDALGHLRFLAFYIICGLAASAAHVWYEPDSIIPSLGASGAIAGVLGAYLILFPQNLVKVLFFRSITYMPAFIVLGGWIVIQVFSQISVTGGAGGVAYLAHIGGFVAGIVLLPLLKRRASRVR